ncbi:predicted protein [Naegleria gruberi]|uniref:Predicted protein n=1 Tax=Naegleria gruberi TaxID=5762 RepID=D2W270_NAEGR|nr:uncharacterized protein NAEGRDRAFT_75481 [Naegleria gruberi]EFC36814.1 predicted protein [Naegleria gruberi]|eukprot:XP_002669558.1 predicted protein [Naegleria gruberi strain NEG-M]
MFSAIVAMGEMASHHEPIHDHHVIHSINNNPKSSWKAKVYEKFANMTVGEFKQKYLGAIHEEAITPSSKSRFSIVTGPPTAYTPPTNFDSRQKWPQCVHTVRNQLDCGSCWAFWIEFNDLVSATKVLSDRFCIASNGSVNVIMSPQYQIDCNMDNLGCSGGSLPKTWNFLTNVGSVSEQCRPYKNNDDDDCPSKCVDGKAPSFYKAKSYASIKGLDSIMYEIQNYGPVHASLTVYKDLMSYQSGVYSHLTGNEIGGHAIVIIGFGMDSLSKKPYWIIANSWGENGSIPTSYKISNAPRLRDDLHDGFGDDSQTKKPCWTVANSWSEKEPMSVELKEMLGLHPS